MPRIATVQVPWPLRGLHKNFGYNNQPVGTTPDALNVRSYDPGSGRARGSQRLMAGPLRVRKGSGSGFKLHARHAPAPYGGHVRPADCRMGAFIRPADEVRHPSLREVGAELPREFPLHAVKRLLALLLVVGFGFLRIHVSCKSGLNGRQFGWVDRGHGCSGGSQSSHISANSSS